jgi:hypothetical protein
MALTIVETRAITGGVDTHADVHVAAALDPIGGLLGVADYPAATQQAPPKKHSTAPVASTSTTRSSGSNPRRTNGRDH